MTRRPHPHRLGDLAASRVATIFEECGFAVERIAQDYGEDLLVQTTRGDDVDPSRIWVQVKGRSRIKWSAGGMWNERVTIDHALRWARSADLVVLAVWDFQCDCGYWSLPIEQVDQWDLYLLQQKSARLQLSSDNRLEQSTAERLAWRARFQHYNGLLLNAYERDEMSAITDHATAETSRSLVPLICFDFLRVIGFIEEEGIDPASRTRFANGIVNLARDDPDADRVEIGHQAAMLTLLVKAEEVAGEGMPHTLLKATHELAYQFLSGGLPFGDPES
jgi:hypothetical protein